MKHDQAQPETTKLPEITLRKGWLERDIARAQKRMIKLTKGESARFLSSLGRGLASPTRDDGSSKKEFRRG